MESQIVAGRMSRVEFITLVAALIAINAVAIDIMLPGLQQIGEALGEPDENRRQLVIPIYLLGFGALQILFGPLSDRYGRRTPLLFGLVVYLIGAAGCLFVNDYNHLLAMRLLQGSGAAASAVVATALVRDLFVGEQMAKTFSLIFMVIMVSPILAPSIGQVIITLLEWRGVFLFMLAFAIIVTIWVALRLPETLKPEHKRPFTLKAVVEGFGIVFTNRIAAGYILGSSIMFSSLFAYLGSAQQIFDKSYGVAPLFPYLFGIGGVFTAIGAFCNAQFVARFGMRRLSRMALALFTFVSILMATAGLAGVLTLPVFMVLMIAAFFTFSFIGANFSALALEPLGEVAGTAASAQGFMQLVVGALLGGAIGQLFDGTPVPMAIAFAVLGCVAGVVVLWGDRRSESEIAASRNAVTAH
jgi:MFS transporter, DHA1 family, multidrug resistance protein